MSRNGSGVYSLPSGSVIANGDTSDATDLNVPLADIASDLNVARPVVAGGTGATSASGARTALGLGIGTDIQAFSANLDSLSGLTFDVNRALYTTGANTAALYVLTPLARTFAAQSTAAGQRGVLELGTAAEVDTGVLSGDVPVLEDVGGSPGLPAVDGSQLTGISGLTFQQSGNLTLAGGGVPWVHGNGLGLPKFFGAKIVCNTTDRGYAVGDTVNLCDREGDGSRPLAVVAESTTITLENSGSIFLIAKGSTTDAAITFASWDLILWGVW